MDPCNPRFGFGADRAAAVAVPALRRAALALREALRHAARQRQRRRLAGATLRSLQSLDAHTLHDIGLDRSEIPSMVAELLGAADGTRARTVRSALPLLPLLPAAPPPRSPGGDLGPRPRFAHLTRWFRHERA